MNRNLISLNNWSFPVYVSLIINHPESSPRSNWISVYANAKCFHLQIAWMQKSWANTRHMVTRISVPRNVYFNSGCPQKCLLKVTEIAVARNAWIWWACLMASGVLKEADRKWQLMFYLKRTAEMNQFGSLFVMKLLDFLQFSGPHLFVFNTVFISCQIALYSPTILLKKPWTPNFVIFLVRLIISKHNLIEVKWTGDRKTKIFSIIEIIIKKSQNQWIWYFVVGFVGFVNITDKWWIKIIQSIKKHQF